MINVHGTLLSKKWIAALCVILIIAGVAARVSFINADAPQDISISAAIYTDEGFKTYSPRNRVLFGDWKWTPEDEYRSWVNSSPVATASYTWIFNNFGVSFLTIRSLSIFYGIMTVLLLFLFMFSCYDLSTALAGTAFFSANFFVIMFNRLGLYETHLVFYSVLALFLVYFSWRVLHRLSRKGKSFNIPFRLSHVLVAAIMFSFALAAMITGFYIKKSITLILVSLFPAIILSIMALSQKTDRKRTSMFTLIMGLMVIGYFLFAHLSFLHSSLDSFFNLRVMGVKIDSILPLRSLAPIYVLAGKGMYREFVFLQPVILFLAFYYAVYTFYRFSYREEKASVDLYLSSWFFFGFVLLMMLQYNPARYFLMLSVPAAILASRGLHALAAGAFSEFRKSQRPFTINAVLAVGSFFSVLYSAIIMYVHLVPFSIRNRLYDSVYPHAIGGTINKAMPVILPVGAGVIIIAIIFFFLRKRISNWIFNPSNAVILLLIILAFHCFQSGRWMITHDDDLYSLSRELGETLPEGAVIAGSWSAGLVCENRLRALIIQSKNTYNYTLFKKIIRNEPVSVNRLREGSLVREQETDIPLYFAVSPNVIFEKKIVQEFGEFIRPDRLTRKVRLGYFDIQIYRIR